MKSDWSDLLSIFLSWLTSCLYSLPACGCYQETQGLRVRLEVDWLARREAKNQKQCCLFFIQMNPVSLCNSLPPIQKKWNDNNSFHLTHVQNLRTPTQYFFCFPNIVLQFLSGSLYFMGNLKDLLWWKPFSAKHGIRPTLNVLSITVADCFSSSELSRETVIMLREGEK